MQSAATRTISARVFSMRSVPIDQALDENGSRIEARLSWVDWSSPLVTIRAPVIVPPGRVRSAPRRGRRHSMAVITVESMIIQSMAPIQVLVLAVPMILTPRRRSWTMSRLNCVGNHRSAMDPIMRLRNGRVMFSRCSEQRSDLQ